MQKENENIKKISNNYINFIKKINKNKKSSSKNFYIVIKEIPENKKQKIDENLEKIIFDKLNDKYFNIKECLSRCGNKAQDISEKENILKILYSFFNSRKNLLENIPVEETILNCDDFRMFQKVVKLSNKYQWVEHERLTAINTKHDNKAYRVFASTNPDDGRLLKCKLTEKGVKKDKFGNTPDKCFIFNDDLTDVKIPKTLDKQYYINLAKKRLEDFGV